QRDAAAAAGALGGGADLCVEGEDRQVDAGGPGVGFAACPEGVRDVAQLRHSLHHIGGGSGRRAATLQPADQGTEVSTVSSSGTGSPVSASRNATRSATSCSLRLSGTMSGSLTPGKSEAAPPSL